jgi:hypothetical protein
MEQEQMNTFRLVIAGSRSFCNYDKLEEVVNNLLVYKKNECRIEVISGGAQGPDTLGRAYALKHGYRICLMPAKWDEEGRSAGMRRNERMAEYADAAVVFYDGSSPGTTHMIKTMLAMKKPIRVVLVDTVMQGLIKHLSAEEINAVGR